MHHIEADRCVQAVSCISWPRGCKSEANDFKMVSIFFFLACDQPFRFGVRKKRDVETGFDDIPTVRGDFD
jgi:hypothetical protein